MNYFLNPSTLIVAGTALTGLLFTLRARRRQARIPHIIAGTIVFLYGVYASLNLLLHTVAVLALPFEGFGFDPAFTYDFRFYSLVMFGLVALIPALLVLRAAPGLTRGRRAARKHALRALTVLIVINLPLIPIQAFAPVITGGAMLCLLPLLALRSWKEDRVDADPDQNT